LFELLILLIASFNITSIVNSLRRRRNKFHNIKQDCNKLKKKVTWFERIVNKWSRDIKYVQLVNIPLNVEYSSENALFW